jgi:hypothetical protein
MAVGVRVGRGVGVDVGAGDGVAAAVGWDAQADRMTVLIRTIRLRVFIDPLLVNTSIL